MWMAARNLWTSTNIQADALGFWEEIAIPVRPPGALGSTAQVRLVSQEGREIATDVRPMSWWNDGSLRWILLDFADSPEQKTVTLEFGREVTRRAVPKDAVLQVFSESWACPVSVDSFSFEFFNS